MSAKIFVSYSRKDSPQARKLIEAFAKMGYDVWVDWEDIPPATNWLDQIKRGIEQADSFIFFISPDSIASEVCNVEVNHAAKYNKRIIPIVLRDVSAKDTNNVVRQLNWIFLREADDQDGGLKRFRDAMELDFEWVARHNRLLGKALDWHHGKESSLLLYGSELRRVQKDVEQATDKEPKLTDMQAMFLAYSLKNERLRLVRWIMIAIVVTVLAALTAFALAQRDRAIENEVLANTNAELANDQRLKAEENERLARRNAEEALLAKDEAEKQRSVAETERERAEERARFALAQQSAARAQIYQSQPGELYTSTLLAVASWTTAPSDEAEEILRKNISLLPIPVGRAQREGRINALSFNAQGDLFVTAGVDGNACVWRASDGAMLFCRTSPGSVNDAVFSPDGKLLITGDESGLVQFIRMEDGGVSYTYEAGEVVRDLDIRRAGDQVAVTREDGRITLVDARTGVQKYNLQATGQVRVASFSPNGRYFATGTIGGTVTLWNLNEGGAPVSSGRHRGEVLALAFSPDSRFLVSGGADGYAVVARTSNGQDIYRRLHEESITDIAFNPKDGLWFATVSNDRRIRVWETFSGDELLRMSQDGFVNAVSVSASGQWIATTGADHTVRVWNASTGTQVFQIPLKNAGIVLGFSGDGRNLAAGDASGEINIWDLSVIPAPENYLQFSGLAGDVQYSPSGDWLAASDGPRVWLLRPGQLPTLTTRPLEETSLTLNGDVRNVVFSPDSVWLGVSTVNGQVLVYNLDTRRPRTLFQSGLGHQIAFTPDGSHLVTTSAAGAVELWSLASFRRTAELAAEGSGVVSVAVSPAYIALGATDRISILTPDGEPVTEIGSPGDHSLLAFSADGSLLASSNSAGLIEVWQQENGSFSQTGSIRKEFVSSLAFNPNTRVLAVGVRDNVFLIDPLEVREVARIPHAGDVTGLAYSVDGDRMATASLRSIQFWQVAPIQAVGPDDLVGAACSRMDANFSQAQWSNLFGGEEYRVLCPGLPVP